MPIISNLYDKAKERNILSGIVISDLIAFFAYLIFPSGFAFFGDFHMIIGTGIGVYFGLSHKKEMQSYIKTGLIVGLLGALFSGISIAFFEWTIYIIRISFSLTSLLLFLGVFIIEAIIIGIPIGGILGLYFKSKGKTVPRTNKREEEFYRSLEEQ
ncbi:MAG: hypothetical protein EU533_04800 [Promethearchaeota archaeon]|nr:MAG: hypothetical protein EU533_04800 [Candidatus Lokiarchaeota archaeon]